MAVVSAGYDGTVDEAQWASLHINAGLLYCVEGINDLAVTGVAGTRTIQVGTGVAVGWGVRDQFTTTTTLQATANATNADRFDTVVVRRNWSTNSTVLALVVGPASPGWVTAATPVPGVLTEQPIAVVRVPSNATTLVGTTVYDFRQWHAHNQVGGSGTPTPFPTWPTKYQTWTDDSGNTYMFNGSTWIGGSNYHLANVSVDFTFPAANWTNLDLLTSTIAEGGAVHDPNRLIAPVDGLYEVATMQRYIGTGSTSNVTMVVRKNSGGSPSGGTPISAVYEDVTSAAGKTLTAAAVSTRLVAGDYVQRFSTSSLGGVVVAGGNPATSTFSLKLIRG